MLIIMKPTATTKETSAVVARITANGYEPHISENGERTLVGIVGTGSAPLTIEDFDHMEGVEQVTRVSAPYKRASREFHPADTLIPLNHMKVGSKQIGIIAGPCSVES